MSDNSRPVPFPWPTERPPSPHQIKVVPDDIVAGDWFLPLAIRGQETHDRIEAAIERGAVGFFYEKQNKDLIAHIPSSIPRIEVESLREALFSMASSWRQNLSAIPITAITGSNGKTTVKEMVSSIFNAAGSSLHTHGNLNTKVGIASHLLQLDPQHQRAVFEVGARRFGDLDLPLRLLRPQIAACLNIGEAHLGEFGSQDALVKTKLSIYANPINDVGRAIVSSSNLHAAIAPANDPRIVSAARATVATVITFGTEADADVRLVSSTIDRATLSSQIEFDLSNLNSSTRLCVSVAGVHEANGLNAAAAIAIAIANGIGPLEIIRGLESYCPPARRFEILCGRDETDRERWLIDDSFNASPRSLQEGLRSLRTLFPQESIALVLGPMLELGESEARLHFESGRAVQTLVQPNELFVVGDLGRDIAAGAIEAGLRADRIRAFESTEDLLAALMAAPPRTEVVYLKASKAFNFHHVTQSLRHSVLTSDLLSARR